MGSGKEALARDARQEGGSGARGVSRVREKPALGKTLDD